MYTLGYPNQEVKTSFLEVLLQSHTQELGRYEVGENSSFLLLAGYLQEEKRHTIEIQEVWQKNHAHGNQFRS